MTGPAYLQGNRDELHSAFSNLVSNAVRYTPEGGAIKLRWFVRAGQPVFSVQDSGIGIEAHHIPRLTERFYRVDLGRSRETGGTGLGLAIVKHIALRHHAHLEISSQTGHGSTFSLLFSEAKIG
jgi:two-component system phosphate regulon sensor histidine kinase PhoR